MSRKLTIGIFNDVFFPMTDGVVMVVDNYARRLCKYANVIVFVPKCSNFEYDDSKFPYKVVRCNSLKVPFTDYSLPLSKLDRNFLQELNSYKLDIVHIHSPFTIGLAGVNYAKKHNIPCIGTMHSQFKQDFERFVKSKALATKMVDRLIKVFNKCDECWAVNNEVARIFYEDCHYKTLPKVMNNATDMAPVIDKKAAIEYINNKYKIGNDEKVFLFVGRINILKNILFIADALKIVKEKIPSIRFKMLYIGTGQDESILRQRIEDNSLNDSVIMCGKITDRMELSYLYKRADLFLFPSIYDASSLVQIEVASQGTPGVFLKGAATANTVTDNINGFISENSVEAYADKIIEIINNKKLYDKVSTNAYKDLYKSWDKVVSKAYRLYIELIENKMQKEEK